MNISKIIVGLVASACIGSAFAELAAPKPKTMYHWVLAK